MNPRMNVKLFKENVFLTMEEYNKIVDYFNKKNTKVNISRQIIIVINEDTKLTFNINIKNSSDKLYISINNRNKPVFTGKRLVKYCDTFSKIMGITEYELEFNISERERVSYYFHFNIDIVYDAKYFSNKYSYYKNKQNILNMCIENELHDQISNEIIFAEFKNEKELALATYCLLLNNCSIVYRDNFLHFYEKKLFYIGIELSDYNGLWENYITKKYKQLPNKMKSKDVLKLMLSFIYFLKEDYDSLKNIKDEEYRKDIHDKANSLYDSYIRLLED